MKPENQEVPEKALLRGPELKSPIIRILSEQVTRCNKFTEFFYELGVSRSPPDESLFPGQGRYHLMRLVIKLEPQFK